MRFTLQSLWCREEPLRALGDVSWAVEAKILFDQEELADNFTLSVTLTDVNGPATTQAQHRAISRKQSHFMVNVEIKFDVRQRVMQDDGPILHYLSSAPMGGR